VENRQNRQDAKNESQEYPYGYGLGLGSRLKLFLNKGNNIRKLSFFMNALFLGILFLGALIRGNKTPDTPATFTLFLSFFIWGLLGFFYFYGKIATSRSGIIIRGKQARSWGIFMMIVGWGLAFSILFEA
jgi:hypothetical protein